jgi:uncharacterized protein
MAEYLVTGGFPEVVISDFEGKDYLGVLFDSLLFKDVIKRYKVKSVLEIGNLGLHFLNNFANLYSLRKIQDSLNLKSVTTIEKFVRYLEDAYLIFSLLRYSHKSLQRLKSPKKVYIVDNGFISAKAIQHSPDKGRLMENLVFIELIKRGLKINHELFYYKTRNDREIDFVIKKGTKVRELIQVCYNVHNQNAERETKALVEANEELKAEKLTILTWDEKRELKQKGVTINFKPLAEWLL